jgi:predicted flap endonuclease-1-like 5' DNA nuclease
MLNARGIIRYDQLAQMTPAEIDLLDGQLGPFRGRLQRDRVVEQADYLARGDKEGFEARFGSLDC